MVQRLRAASAAERVFRAAGAFNGLIPRGLCILALTLAIFAVLGDDLRQLDWAAVSQAVRAVSLADLAIALLLTAVSYYAMAMYDGVALRILGYRLPGRLSLRAGFAATSLGQTLGFGVLVGTAVRWRFYRGTGISATTSGLVTGVVSTGFFIALILLVSACIAFGSFDFSEMTGLSPAMLQTAALAILAGGALLFAIAYLQPRIRLAGRTLPLPRFQPLVRISALAVLDIVPAAAALWMLLPADVAPTFTQLLPIYAVALGLALVSNTPGGLGVLEFACLLAWPLAPAESIIAALILYRVVYYGAPFLLGLAFLADHESRRKGKGQSRAVWQHGAEESDAALLSKAHRAEANLIQQGDKRLFRSSCGQAGLMYRDTGNARVALSDPIGPREAWQGLISEYLQACRHDLRTPVFYKATRLSGEGLRAAGLAAHQIGEEAILDPSQFSLDGPERRGLRRKIRQAEKAGVEVRIHAAGSAPMDDLRAVNAAWLDSKGGAEKGFSLGRFEPDYLARFITLEARQEGRTLAFVSLWQSGEGAEWSVDLMQSLPESPCGTMHKLIVEAVAVAREAGAQRFSLCAVQFSLGRPPATLVERLVHLVWQRKAEGLGLAGLRRFKDMFAPSWEPVYLAAPKAGLPLTALLSVNRLVNTPERKR